MEAALFDDAHLFFRKAIEEEGEWATNKRLIETAGKGLRGAIPRGFSYFHVAWAGGGFVHPIENEAKFPEEWGLDVAAGMLGQAPARFGRREGAAGGSSHVAKKWRAGACGAAPSAPLWIQGVADGTAIVVLAHQERAARCNPGGHRALNDLRRIVRPGTHSGRPRDAGLERSHQ
jgi:hypothetical protein